GGSGTNKIGNSFGTAAVPMVGIGREKAEQIAYLTLLKLTSQAVFEQARDASIQAAFELYGPGSPQLVATTNAWFAVGVGSPYGVLSKRITYPTPNATDVDPWPVTLVFETPLNLAGLTSADDFEWEWEVQVSADSDFANVQSDIASNQIARAGKTVTQS